MSSSTTRLSSASRTFPLVFDLRVIDNATGKLSQVKVNLSQLNPNIASSVKSATQLNTSMTQIGQKAQAGLRNVSTNAAATNTSMAKLSNTVQKTNTSLKQTGNQATDTASKFQRMRPAIFSIVGLATSGIEAIGNLSTLGDVQQNVAEAQEEVNEALKKGGEDSKEYKRAIDNLKDAQRGYNFILRNTILSFTDLIPFSLLLVNSIANMKAKTAEAAAAQTALNSKMTVATASTSRFSSLTGSLLFRLGPLALVMVGLTAAFFALKNNVFGVTTFLQDLGFQLGKMFPFLKPFLKLIEGIGGALGIIEVKKNTLPKAIADIKKQFGAIWEGFTVQIGLVQRTWGHFWRSLSQGHLGDALKTIEKSLGKGFISFTNLFPKDIKKPLQDLGKRFKKGWEAFKKGDFEAIGQGIVDAILDGVQWLQNDVWPKLSPFVNAAWKWLQANGPKIGKALIDAITAGLIWVGNKIWAAMTVFADFAWKWLQANGPDIGKAIIDAIISGLVWIGGQIWAMMTQFADLAWKWIQANGPDIGKAIIDAIVSGLIWVGNNVWSVLTQFADFAWKWIQANGPKIGKAILDAIISGLIWTGGKIWEAMTEFANFAWKWLQTNGPKIGKAIIEAIISGLVWARNNVWPAMTGFINEAYTWLKTNMPNVGTEIVKGILNAISWTQEQVNKAFNTILPLIKQWINDNIPVLGPLIANTLLGGINLSNTNNGNNMKIPLYNPDGNNKNKEDKPKGWWENFLGLFTNFGKIPEASGATDSDSNTKQTTTVFNDLITAMDNYVKKIVEVTNSVNSLTTSHNSLARTIVNISKDFNLVIESSNGVIDIYSTLGRTILNIIKDNNTLARTVVTVSKDFNKAADSASGLVSVHNSLARTIVNITKDNNVLARTVVTVSKDFNKAADSASDWIKKNNSLARTLVNVEKDTKSLTKAVKSLKSALNSIPKTVKTNFKMSVSGTAPQGVKLEHLAQGGVFVTQGPQLIMVGDNPGGRELVMAIPSNKMGGKIPKIEGTSNVSTFSNSNNRGSNGSGGNQKIELHVHIGTKEIIKEIDYQLGKNFRTLIP